MPARLKICQSSARLSHWRGKTDGKEVLADEPKTMSPVWASVCSEIAQRGRQDGYGLGSVTLNRPKYEPIDRYVHGKRASGPNSI